MSQVTSRSFVTNFTSGSILPRIIVFSFPLFVANLLQAVYNVVDMVVVGQVVGEAGLSGVAIGGDVLSLLTFICMGLSGAGQVIISQYVGAQEKGHLSKFIGTLSSFMMLSAVVVCMICLLLRGQILSVLNTPDEAWLHAMEYSTVCMFGLIFIYGYNIVSAILRGMGDSKRPLFIIGIAAVLNLLLDLLFVAVFHWGAFGAALATVVAQGISFLTAVVYLCINRERLGFQLSACHFRMDRVELAALIRLGVPMAIRSAAIMFSKLFVNSYINSFGVTVSAVTGVGHKVDLFGNLMGNAISSACNSMVGQNIGARKYNRIPRIIGVAFLLSSLCFGLASTVIVLFPQTVFGFFTDDLNVLRVCLEYVPVLVVTFVAGALRDTMYGFLFGCGNARVNYIVAIMDGLFARIGFSLLLGLALGYGYFGFWIGNALAGAIPFFIGAVFYLSGKWKKSEIITTAE